MRPVFTHSKQAAKTPQSGSTDKSQANKTSSIKSSNVVENSATQVVDSSKPKTNADLPLSKQILQNQNRDNSTHIQKVAKLGSIFSSPPKTNSVAEQDEESIKLDNASSPDNVIKIDQLSLITAWKAVSSNNQVFDKASMMRIRSVEPTLIDNHHFEISVANPNVELFFKQNRNLILSQLSAYLGNHKMTMTIKIIESSDSQKILTTAEQVNEMVKQNPAFKKLMENLNLSMN